MFFSSIHGTFSRIDHMLGHKTSLNKFKKVEISSIFSKYKIWNYKLYASTSITILNYIQFPDQPYNSYLWTLIQAVLPEHIFLKHPEIICSLSSTFIFTLSSLFPDTFLNNPSHKQYWPEQSEAFLE